ncbi:MAG: glycosyltransferase [Deltaproteobacteria bacterium]|nr:glycosyltransferase [Deltaproteobacteria bacterium]
MKKVSVAILIPCYNEAITIGKVIRDFREVLPDAKIYVFDNNSTDDTAVIAHRNGAIVQKEPRQGKGYVVQSMFRRVEADFYLMVDGDDTYPASYARELIEPVISGDYDMSVGVRLQKHKDKSFPRFHLFGNYLIRGLIRLLFGVRLKDIFSGYRCFSRRFVKGCPTLSQGFEIETELTLQAIDKRFNITEIEIPYGERPEGSYSKLNTFRDGLLVVKTILRIFRDYKPLVFFLTLASLGLIVGLIAGWVVVDEYIETRYVSHVPLAIFSVGSVLLSFILAGIGLVLDTINRRFDELFNVQIKSMREN